MASSTNTEPLGPRTEEALFTADPASRRLALAEVQAALPGSRLRRWLGRGVGWVDLGSGWSALADRFREDPPVFCRHICPVHLRVPLTIVEADLDTLAAATEALRRNVEEALLDSNPFSVQTRLLGHDWPYKPYDVNTRLAGILSEGGWRLDVRNPAIVLSVVLAERSGYLGLSRAENNLSDWAGGARRFRKEPDQISRAEFKLLEALEVFALDPAGAETALDLGAAPGGWTRILRQHGVKVVAVDPAALAPPLRRDPGVHHLEVVAQVYLSKASAAFDIVLNDMRMDARDSARLMVSAAPRLKPNGWALMTLKLPKRGTAEVMTAALEILGAAYEVTGVRQLFHNRSEVTAALRRM
ncbi:MAG: SAM-dependent methyltransferase [Anaerolineae bacterium]